jgi:peptidoglycan/LPS O-acetylase OafA/YrhL/lysophospholipase L1-like esterase
VSRPHIPGLDGLRGLAVAGVLLFHANALLRGGYLGVDLFFVLSGFLITRILLDDRDGGRVDLKRFWIRRARRLMPALLAMMPAVAIYAKVVARPNELVALRADALATLAYVANWRAIFAHRSYWEMFVAPSPLEHTWSLAIEEQFYVVWPLVVALLGRRRLLWACIVLAIASALTMALSFEEGNTTRVYLGTDTRGAAILIGAALACFGELRGGKRLDLAAMVALGVLAIAWVTLDGQSELLYRGGFFVTEIAAAVLIAACVTRPESKVARLFAFAPLRALGTISYGVYLWHWPVYVVLTEERTHASGLALLTLRVAVTLVIALVSYRFLERPIRERGLSFGKPVVVVPGAFAAAVLSVVLSTRAVVASPAPTLAPVAAPEEKAAPAKTTQVVDFGVIPPASALADGTLRVLVLGDSVALALGARMHFAQDSAHAYADHRAIGDCSILDGITPVFSMSGPPHGNGNCARNWVTDVEELKPDVTAIVLGGAYFSTVEVDGRRRSVCHPGWGAAYGKRLRELLEAIAPHTKRRAVVLAAYPVGKWQTPTLNGKVDCYNRILKEAAESAGADAIDLNAFVCPNGRCTITSRDAPVRPDGLHFDGLGAEDTARWVLQQLRQPGTP